MAGKGKPGPATTYTPWRAERICELIAEGYTLRQVAEAEGLNKATVTLWLRNQPAFRQQYDQAFSLWCEIQAHEMVDIASDGSNDWMDRETASGRIERVVDYEHIHRSKLRIDPLVAEPSQPYLDRNEAIRSLIVRRLQVSRAARCRLKRRSNPPGRVS